MKLIQDLPPFLAKLLILTQNTSSEIAKWARDGSVFVIVDEDKFKKTLKKYYKGTKQTFIRQLHFYGFKKVDTEEGVWGFSHEKNLFVKDNTDLIRTIKRKKTVDPDTQKIATYHEVQGLKNQVTFLQEIIEELREQVLDLRKGNVSGKKMNKSTNSTVSKSFKRQRKDEHIDFDSACANVNPPLVDISRIPSFTNTKDFETESNLENLSDLFVDLDLEPIDSEDVSLRRIPSYQQSLIDDNENFGQAVEAIADATQVRKVDVSKILSFLSNLSMKEKETLEVMTDSCAIPAKLKVPRVQKVGAN